MRAAGPGSCITSGPAFKATARRDPRPGNAGLNALTWDYALTGPPREPRVREVLQEINGYTVSDRTLVGDLGEPKADGSTACGCWNKRQAR